MRSPPTSAATDGEELATGRLVLLHDPTASRRGTACCAWSRSPRPNGPADGRRPDAARRRLELAERRARPSEGPPTERPVARSPRRPRPGSATWPGHAPPWPSSCGRRGRPTTPTWPAPAGVRGHDLCRSGAAPRGRHGVDAEHVTSSDGRRQPDGIPLLREPGDGVPEPITTSGATARRGRCDGGRVRPGRGRRRARLGLPLQPARLPDPAAPRRRGHRADRPDRTAATCPSSTRRCADAEWILHAANQDLPCLAEVGLRPAGCSTPSWPAGCSATSASRSARWSSSSSGVRLEKGHSAADWSTRPLPHDWLAYAALDVELLVPLRAVVEAELTAAGKREWAAAGVRGRARCACRHRPRVEPWRRTSGIHRVRNRRQLAAVRSLWRPATPTPPSATSRPGASCPTRRSSTRPAPSRRRPADLAELPVFRRPAAERQARALVRRPRAAARCPQDRASADHRGRGDGCRPPAARWRERDPGRPRGWRGARGRGRTGRAAHRAGPEPAGLRRRAPAGLGAAGRRRTRPRITARLAELGARPWQIELTGDRWSLRSIRRPERTRGLTRHARPVGRTLLPASNNTGGCP